MNEQILVDEMIAAGLRLRFDKVVIRVVSQARAVLADGATEGRCTLFTLTAPIRQPARTAADRAGPMVYDARAGAFVAGDGFANVKDLTHQDWQTAFAGADNAMVSYPLLIGDDGQTHVATKSRWLANRTFVGRDSHGLIIVGTTREAFFSLDRLADFLKRAPLDLGATLNLDGGPIACQSVRFNGFHRKFYAKWEAQIDGDKVRLLTWPLADRTWAMPMVLTVERR